MLKLSIKNPTTQETETYDVATEFNQFFNQAKEYGLINSIFSLRVNAMRDENAPIRLHADSDVGNGLLSILDGDDSLYDVRVIDEEISDVPEEHREYLESNLVNEQYSDVDELFNDIKATTKFFAPVKMSFFCPLAGNINDHEGDYYEADGAMLTENIDKIEDAIRSEQARELKMGEYISDHADIKGKVLFAEWGVEEHYGALYGKNRLLPLGGTLPRRNRTPQGCHHRSEQRRSRRGLRAERNPHRRGRPLRFLLAIG